VEGEGEAHLLVEGEGEDHKHAEGEEEAGCRLAAVVVGCSLHEEADVVVVDHCYLVWLYGKKREKEEVVGSRRAVVVEEAARHHSHLEGVGEGGCSHSVRLLHSYEQTHFPMTCQPQPTTLRKDLFLVHKQQ
jgi:hypothetical protein